MRLPRNAAVTGIELIEGLRRRARPHDHRRDRDDECREDRDADEHAVAAFIVLALDELVQEVFRHVERSCMPRAEASAVAPALVRALQPRELPGPWYRDAACGSCGSTGRSWRSWWSRS